MGVRWRACATALAAAAKPLRQQRPGSQPALCSAVGAVYPACRCCLALNSLPGTRCVRRGRLHSLYSAALFRLLQPLRGLGANTGTACIKTSCNRSPKAIVSTQPARPLIAIHGGAGTISRDSGSDREVAYHAALKDILTPAQQLLAAGGTALDAVTLAVELLE